MAILSSYDKDEREQYIGIVELFFGLGLLFGPIFGALFYNLGGYMMPFIAFGSIYFFFWPAIVYVMMKASRLGKQAQLANELNSGTAEENAQAEKVDVDLIALLKKPRFFFGLASQGFIAMSLLYI
jgi:MFS family permease